MSAVRDALKRAAGRVVSFLPGGRGPVLPAMAAAEQICEALASEDPDRIEHLSDRLYERVRQNPMAKEAVLAEFTRLEQQIEEDLSALREEGYVPVNDPDAKSVRDTLRSARGRHV